MNAQRNRGGGGQHPRATEESRSVENKGTKRERHRIWLQLLEGLLPIRGEQPREPSECGRLNPRHPFRRINRVGQRLLRPLEVGVYGVWRLREAPSRYKGNERGNHPEAYSDWHEHVDSGCVHGSLQWIRA